MMLLDVLEMLLGILDLALARYLPLLLVSIVFQCMYFYFLRKSFRVGVHLERVS